MGCLLLSDDKAFSAPPSWLPLVLATAPIVVVHVCYLLSAHYGYVDKCNPYIEGCTSISAAGRHGPSYFLFKAGMIPVALLAIVFWVYSSRWLRSSSDRRPVRTLLLAIIGCTSALFLIVYTISLGSHGDLYRFMRRVGVIIYFSCSYLAQLLLLAGIQRLTTQGHLSLPRYALTGKYTLVIGLMIFGAASIPIMNYLEDKDALQNSIEWWFSLLMTSYYFFTWRIWRSTTGIGYRKSAPKPGGIKKK